MIPSSASVCVRECVELSLVLVLAISIECLTCYGAERYIISFRPGPNSWVIRKEKREIASSITSACGCVCVCRASFAESYQFSVPESLPVASVVAKIKALDSDIGPNAEMDYRIIEGDGLGVFRGRARQRYPGRSHNSTEGKPETVQTLYVLLAPLL